MPTIADYLDKVRRMRERADKFLWFCMWMVPYVVLITLLMVLAILATGCTTNPDGSYTIDLPPITYDREGLNLDAYTDYDYAICTAWPEQPKPGTVYVNITANKSAMWNPETQRWVTISSWGRPLE